MTKHQRNRLNVSQAQLKMLRRIRYQEMQQSGVGVVPGEVALNLSQWGTLSALVRKKLLAVDDQKRIRTAGAARQINLSWSR